MKKISFPLIVILFISIIIALIGYNALVIHNDSKKYEEIKKNSLTIEPETQTSSSDKQTIYCIGDSLTLGNKTSSYATALSSSTDYSVNKFGGSQDQTIDIAIRMGRIKIYVNNITIESEVTPVSLQILDKNGEAIDVLRGKGNSFSTVEINGITGKLKYDNQNKTHTFTRDEPGESMVISHLTQIKSEINEFETDSIAVIFTGSYDPAIPNGIFKTITYQRGIINQLKTKKYIVVSLTSKRRFPIVDDMNKVLQQEHGEHFLDFRSYLLESGLDDAHVKATPQDKKDLENRYIPSSLLKEDKLNGNSKFNELLSQQIIKKIKELNY